MWPSWIVIVLGIWLIVAPWALGYDQVLAARYNSIIVGVLVVMFGYLSSIPIDKRTHSPGQN